MTLPSHGKDPQFESGQNHYMYKTQIQMVIKIGKSSTNKKMHYSVGAIIEKNKKYLIIDRAIFPYGYAGIAGHIDIEDKTPGYAIKREIKEESGYSAKNCNLLFKEEIENNPCSRGASTHYWYLYKCEVSGRIKQNKKETKSIGWCTKQQIQKLYKQKKLEPVWEYWFKKLNII